MRSSEAADNLALRTITEDSKPLHPTFFPFHIIPGVSNFRDIGGWPISTDAASQVRKGILYRGSDTNRITPEGEGRLRELGIKTDFDLRSRQQIERTGGYREMDGISRIWAPVFADEQYTEEAASRRYELYAGEGTEGIVEAFVEILTSGVTTMGMVVQHVLASVDAVQSGETVAGLFLHCTTGNNRTGVFISLLLLLVGASHDSVMEEYALSEQGLAPTRHINIERLLRKGAFAEHGPAEARRKCERMVGARTESMKALIEEVDRRWGSAEGYFRHEVGLAEDEVARLKQALIVPA